MEELIRYYENNREGLLPYQSQGLELPEPPEGLEYRNMGTMENHVWSVIAKRMKHGHRSWSRRGGNHLAKILAKKCSGKLCEVTERLKRPVFEEEKVEELYGEILMAAKAPKKDGKGYEYPAIGHVVGLDERYRGEKAAVIHGWIPDSRTETWLFQQKIIKMGVANDYLTVTIEMEVAYIWVENRGIIEYNII